MMIWIWHYYERYRWWINLVIIGVMLGLLARFLWELITWLR